MRKNWNVNGLHAIDKKNTEVEEIQPRRLNGARSFKTLIRIFDKHRTEYLSNGIRMRRKLKEVIVTGVFGTSLHNGSRRRMQNMRW